MSPCLSRFSILLLFVCAIAYGQQDSPSLDQTERTAVVTGALRNLHDYYVDPGIAAKMEAEVSNQAKRGSYKSLNDPWEFAQVLTQDLQRASGDRHVHVFYSPDPEEDPTYDSDNPMRQKSASEMEKRLRFGFEQIVQLQGNVGYLDLRAFSGLAAADSTAVSAMNFLADTDALIIDLRNNGGGSPHMIDLLASYLFDGVVHLNDFYERQGNRTVQFYTSAEVRGKRYGSKKPVFILTSIRTFSAAEEFAYDLQTLHRAVIVGEQTGGGANPGGPRPIDSHFGIWVSTGRAVNPITKKNWEGVGVTPDIKVDADESLKTAYLDALGRLIALGKSQSAVALTELRKSVQAAPNSALISAFRFK